MGDTWEEQTKPSPHDGKQSSNCLLSELQWIKETSSNALKPNKSFHKLSDEWQVSQESWYRRMPIFENYRGCYIARGKSIISIVHCRLCIIWSKLVVGFIEVGEANK